MRRERWWKRWPGGPSINARSKRNSIKVERYRDVDQDGPDPDGGPNPDDVLIARSESFYDTRGRVYQTKTYAVDPTIL